MPGAEIGKPDLYRVGCAGHIESWEKFPDGRFFVQLKGVHRFSFETELELKDGYRRVNAIYSDYQDFAPETWQCDRAGILQALRSFGQTRGMEVKPEQAARFSDTELVNLLAVSLPLHPAEKQALLEAPTCKERERTLISLLSLAADPGESEDDLPRRTLN